MEPTAAVSRLLHRLWVPLGEQQPARGSTISNSQDLLVVASKKNTAQGHPTPHSMPCLPLSHCLERGAHHSALQPTIEVPSIVNLTACANRLLALPTFIPPPVNAL